MAKPAKERNCRNNIATLLSLMGFHDDDSATTVKTMRQKLKKIQQKARFKKPRHSTFKKPVVSTFNRITFKCGGKTTTVSLKPHSSSFIDVDHHNMPVTDSRNINNNNICYLENNKKMMSMINNNVDHHHHQDYISDQRFGNNQQQLMKLKINGHDNYMEIEDSRLTSFDDDHGCMGLHYFIQSMGGCKAKLVIQKQLTSSDCNKGQGRLLIPRMNVKSSGFLTSDEKTELENKQNISVPVFDLERRESVLNLSQWKMNKEVYVLKTGWSSIVKTNGLEQGMVIQVWAFRVKEEQLCFAFVGV